MLTLKIPDILVSLIDIADDKLLLAKYGVRIPVLQRPDTQTELNWPFTEADILELLK